MYHIIYHRLKERTHLKEITSVPLKNRASLTSVRRCHPVAGMFTGNESLEVEMLRYNYAQGNSQTSSLGRVILGSLPCRSRGDKQPLDLLRCFDCPENSRWQQLPLCRYTTRRAKRKKYQSTHKLSARIPCAKCKTTQTIIDTIAELLSDLRLHRDRYIIKSFDRILRLTKRNINN